MEWQLLCVLAVLAGAVCFAASKLLPKRWELVREFPDGSVVLIREYVTGFRAKQNRNWHGRTDHPDSEYLFGRHVARRIDPVYQPAASRNQLLAERGMG